MNKNYFKGSMRSMREFTAEMNSNKASHDRAREKTAEDYAEAKGSMLYDRVFAEVYNDFSTRRAATVEKYKKELIPQLNGMRAEASARVIKAPTTDMVNNLALLHDMEDLTPGTMNMYPHSDGILADFMGENGTATAQRIIDDFESRYRLEHCCERD